MLLNSLLTKKYFLLMPFTTHGVSMVRTEDSKVRGQAVARELIKYVNQEPEERRDRYLQDCYNVQERSGCGFFQHVQNCI